MSVAATVRTGLVALAIAACSTQRAPSADAGASDSGRDASRPEGGTIAGDSGTDSGTTAADSGSDSPAKPGLEAIGTWQGLVRVSFEVKASAGASVVVGYARAGATPASELDLPIRVTLAASGVVEALDGGAYAATHPVTWQATSAQKVELEIDLLGREYSVFVDGALLAEDFAFGPGDMPNLGVRFISGAPGGFAVSRHRVAAPPAPAADGLPAPTRSFTVSELTGPGSLTERISNALPGDEIVLENGVYTLSQPVQVVDRQGTAEKPIVIRAQDVLGVELRGGADVGSFVIRQSSYVVVRGFRFRHGVSPGSSFGIGLRLNGSHHCRVTRSRFRLEESGTSSHWVLIDGEASHDHRLDHLRFEKKRTMNNFLVIYGTSSGNPAMSQRDIIDHNYFFDVPPTGLADGTEAVRLGDSARGYISAHATLEYNLFERCNGDPNSDGYEVISVKSSNNALRYNTLRNNEGALVLRHGSGSRVEGNFFLDNHGGLRFYGDDHVVVNNYFAGITGAGGLQSALYIGRGRNVDGEPVGTDANQPSNVLIAFNTLIDNERTLYISNEASYPYPPRDFRIANNIVSGAMGKLFDFQGAPVGFTYEGNLVHARASASVGNIDGGYLALDPGLARSSDGVFRLIAGSPAIDSAVSSASYDGVVRPLVADDMDGQARTMLKDVGADERATGPTLRGPLTRLQVGPGAP